MSARKRGRKCHRLLTRGPCAPDEYVLLDPADLTGFCAARLCAPDRIFVFSDQLCHDPLNTKLCPPGRQLYQTSYGTPMCQCPDGTYETDDDLDDDVCQPLLDPSPSCPPDQVLWFVDFTQPPRCLPDPCGGMNLRRGPNDLAFVPSAQDGKCYQLGQGKGVCPAQTWYSLALQTLRGVCVSLEDAGYDVFDEATLNYLTQQYGPLITREGATSTSEATPGTTLNTGSSPVTASLSTPASVPNSAPGLVPFPTHEPAQQTPGSTSTGGEPPQAFAKRQGTFTQAGRINRETSGSSDQIWIQNPLSSDLQESTGLRFTGQESHDQKFAGRVEFTDKGSTGQARTEQGSITQHHEAGGQHIHGQMEAPMNVQQRFDRNFHQGNIAHGQESAGQQGSSSVIVEHREASPSSPGQGSPYPTDPSRQGSLNGPLPHITSKLFHPQPPPPTHLSHPPELHPQPSPAFSSLPHQHYFQALPSESPPTYLTSQNQRPQPFLASSSSFLPTSSALSPAAHYSPLGQFQTFQPFTLHNQSASTSPHPLGSRISSHLPTFLSTPTHLAPTDLEQMSLEVFQTPDGGVVSNLGSAGPWNFPLRGLPATHGHRGSSSGAATAWGQQQQQRRRRRSSLPHASPGNVIEPLLAACRAGSQRDVNAKCRDTVLPSTTQAKREVRAAPPVPPRPSCPEGQAYDRKRKCVSGSEAVNSINAFNLGK